MNDKFFQENKNKSSNRLIDCYLNLIQSMKLIDQMNQEENLTNQINSNKKKKKRRRRGKIILYYQLIYFLLHQKQLIFQLNLQSRQGLNLRIDEK